MVTAFADFADWHSNASPMVAVVTDRAAWGDLVLDITGVDHLFGGERRMLEGVAGRLETIGYATLAAIGPTVGAAWALSHFGPDRAIADDPVAALADLPMAALRLDDERVAGLGQMGLKRIGQLFGRDRRALAARFGAELLLRLDQALGHIEEKPTPRQPVSEYGAERRFAEPIGLMDDVLACTADLAVTLALKLEREALGARSFHLFLYRVDHKLITLSVNAARPTREAAHVARLFAERAERLGGEYDAGFGIDMVRLIATSVETLGAVQHSAFEADGMADLEQLFDRMTSRLGPLSVARIKPVDTHIPERATLLEPVVARTPDDPRAMADPEKPRPLRLLPAPEPITVRLPSVPDAPPTNMTWRRVTYRFLRASGPERFEAEWWRTLAKLDLLGPPRTRPPETDDRGRPRPPHHDPRLAAYDPESVVRDYYIVEDDGGRRFWVFRQGLFGQAEEPRWYLHGVFP